MRSEATTLEMRMEWVGLARPALFICAAVLITNLGLPQWATGPLVNALLILSVEWGSVSQGIFVGMVTPMGAALRGVLPLPLMVMIPFIALGNAFLVALYGSLRMRSRWLALGIAAFGKFSLIYGAVTLLLEKPLHLVIGGRPEAVTISSAILMMMGWPQLATALAGGLLAFGVLRITRPSAFKP